MTLVNVIAIHSTYIKHNYEIHSNKCTKGSKVQAKVNLNIHAGIFNLSPELLCCIEELQKCCKYYNNCMQTCTQTTITMKSQVLIRLY